MSNDRLEQFVEKNREAFDKVETFNKELVWARLESKTHSKRISFWKIIAIAAMSLLVILGGLYCYTIMGQNQDFETLAGLTEEQEMQRDEMIRFVNLKEQEVKSKNVDINDFVEFKKELEGLDEIEKLVLGDFSNTVNKEKLVKSMLQYYESKARILELILFEIEKKEKYETFDKEIF